LAGEPGSLVLPIRKEHVYKRYVFLKILKMLRPEYLYSTFSTLQFWIQDKGQPTVEEFIRENRILASKPRNVRIQRLILINEQVLGLPIRDGQDKLSKGDVENRRVALRKVWEVLESREMNENVNHFGKVPKGKALDKLVEELLDRNIINMFVVRTAEVDKSIKQLGDEDLPNAYIEGDGKLMIVKALQGRASSGTATKIQFVFPSDASALSNHRAVFKALLRIALVGNDSLVAKMRMDL
jgi:hypothetical protein